MTQRSLVRRVRRVKPTTGCAAIGSIGGRPLFGQHSWPDKGIRARIIEGRLEKGYEWRIAWMYEAIIVEGIPGAAIEVPGMTFSAQKG